jgi:hypothetical protein
VFSDQELAQELEQARTRDQARIVIYKHLLQKLW